MSRTRRYTHSDLKGLTKNQLIKLIEAQPQHIPNPFNRSKLRKASLIELILSPTTPFRTLDPPLDDAVNVVGQESQDLGPPNDGTHQSDMERSVSLLPEVDRHESEAPGPQAMNEDVEPAPGDHGNLELRLYIEDGRHPGTIHKRTSKTINVKATLLTPNVVEIQTHDIIRELQAGFGAIAGSDSVRVGLQDLVSPDYTDFFVESSPSSLYMSPTDPRTHVIHVEPGKRPFLRLRVDYSRPPARESTHSHEQCSPPPVPLAPAPNDRTPLIHWLRSKAAENDEYSVFNQSKHHVRQNSDIYQSWKLAAELSKHYYKQVHPFHSIPGKIKKSDIYNALEVGETWLSQAEEAERIIHIFGEGGTHPSPEVINRLTQSSGSPEGSVSLLRFLREF